MPGDHCDETSTEPADVWVCRWGECLLLWWHLLSAVLSHWSSIWHWCGISCGNTYTHPMLLLAHDWCGQCPDLWPSHPVRHYRNWFTTVFAWSPRSEHAKANSGISENLEDSSVRVSRETTLKHHRAQNGKNNSVNKRVRTHPTATVKTPQLMIIYMSTSDLFWWVIL